MTVFALVEVVMIILGIVLANHFEKQKELEDIKEDALVLFKGVLNDLEIDIVASERIAQRNVSHNKTSDILMDPNSDDEDNQLNSQNLQMLLGYYSNFIIHNKAFLGLRQIHEDLPEEWAEVYKELELFMDNAINIDIYNKRYQKTIYATFDQHVATYPWYVRDNYVNRMSLEFVEWSKSDLCKSQTMLVLNDIGNLNYEVMNFRFEAIRLHDLIVSTLGLEVKEPKHKHVLHPEPGLLKAYTGTYRLSDPTIDASEKAQTWVIFDENDLLYAKRQKGDTLLLKNCAKAIYQLADGRADLFHFDDDELRIVKFGIEKDWIFRKE